MGKNFNYKFFEYISDYPDKDNFRLMIKLGNYISHKIVGKKFNYKELDDINRTCCAELFLKEYKNDFIRNNKSINDAYINPTLYDKLKKDIAIYIDLKIPYFCYIKEKNIHSSDGYKYYKGIRSVEGKLNYKFKESIILEKFLFEVKQEILTSPTEKQKKYLDCLVKESGYKVINETDMTKEIAAKLIGFIKDDIQLETETQNKFLIYE